MEATKSNEPSNIKTVESGYSSQSEPTAALGEAFEKKAIPELDETIDDDVLADIGYRPELRRHFSTIQVFGVAFSIMGLLPSISSTMSLAMAGGPAGMVWGWFMGGMLILTTGASMAELASSMPTSGGLYYWSYFYAPQKVKVPLSFLVGISNTVGLTSGLCSIDYGLANQILAAAVLGSNDSFTITRPYVYCVYIGCVIAHIIVTSVASAFVSRLQTTSIVANVGLILLFLIALPAGTGAGNFNDRKFIFGELDTFNGWSQGWQFMLCLMPAIWTICGFDSCVYMSEEAKNAARSVPIGIVCSIFVVWLLGFAVMIVIAACMNTDVSAVLNGNLNQPFAQVIYDRLGKKWALGILSYCIVAQFLMGASILTGGSRQIWAFSRDNGLPFSSWIKVVNKKLKVPLHAIQFEGFFALIIGLLCLINATAADAVFSLVIANNYFA